MRCVLIHGLGQTAESWEPVLSNLNRTDVLCPNLYRLAEDIPITYDSLYRGFSDYCNGLDGCLDLCGLSLGGVLALHYTAENPEKVRSLVLAAAQYKMPKRLLQFQNLLFSLLPERAFAQTGLKKRDMLTLCRSMMRLDFSQSLPGISCPTLVVCGQKDSANKKAAMELARQIRSAQLKILPSAGHEVNMAAPEEFAGLLSDFYDTL